MYYFLTLLLSAAAALMVFINGYLARYIDIYLSVIVVHTVGVLSVWGYLWARKIPIIVPAKLPLWLYSGGVIGFLVALFPVMAFGKISLSAIIALSLLGQIVTSLVIDHYGLFSMKTTRFVKRNTIGVFVIAIGIAVMLYGSAFIFLPILLVFSAGISIVISRQINAKLSMHCNPYTASFYNFFTGLVTAVVAYVIYRSLFSVSAINQPIRWEDWWIFSGGIIALGVVILSNVVVLKISSFAMTIITFGGQILTGLLIDYLMMGSFSIQNFVGVLFALSGLGINLLLNRRRVRQPLAIER